MSEKPVPPVVVSNFSVKEDVQKDGVKNRLYFDYTVNALSNTGIRWVNFEICIHYFRENVSVSYSDRIHNGNTVTSRHKFKTTTYEYHKWEYRHHKELRAGQSELVTGCWYYNDFLEDRKILIEDPFVYRAYGECTDGSRFNVTSRPDLNFAGSNYLKISNTKNISPCFIATWAFEDELHPTVVELRKFRDNVLRNHKWGRAFILSYYKIGPSLVSVLGRRRWLQGAVRSILNTLTSVFLRR